MLRALGFSARIVRRAFLSEAGFIAVQGIVLGMGLGLVTSYQMLRSDVFDEAGHVDDGARWPPSRVLALDSPTASRSCPCADTDTVSSPLP
jgi:hypothetical protein